MFQLADWPKYIIKSELRSEKKQIDKKYYENFK